MPGATFFEVFVKGWKSGEKRGRHHQWKKIFEQGAEQFQRFHHLIFHRVSGDVELLGNLCIGKRFEAAQHENGSAAPRQLLNGSAQGVFQIGSL